VEDMVAYFGMTEDMTIHVGIVDLEAKMIEKHDLDILTLGLFSDNIMLFRIRIIFQIIKNQSHENFQLWKQHPK